MGWHIDLKTDWVLGWQNDRLADRLTDRSNNTLIDTKSMQWKLIVKENEAFFQIQYFCMKNNDAGENKGEIINSFLF